MDHSVTMMASEGKKYAHAEEGHNAHVSPIIPLVSDTRHLRPAGCSVYLSTSPIICLIISTDPWSASLRARASIKEGGSGEKETLESVPILPKVSPSSLILSEASRVTRPPHCPKGLIVALL